uniref:Secreted protein n=1 Tax=Pipistrellus kuhlii TaxID=59472 RepID=A0A7J7UGJ7_PIPKU|nr:hypothetical protein mPipKuh1_009084 [Pipistrellus kuhlii]
MVSLCVVALGSSSASVMSCLSWQRCFMATRQSPRICATGSTRRLQASWCWLGTRRWHTRSKSYSEPSRTITVRDPVPSAGVVDIPIMEKEVQGQKHHKMTLSPSYRMDNRKMVKVQATRSAHVAVTKYQTLSSTVSSALLELHPITSEGSPRHGRRHHGPTWCSVLLGSVLLSSWYGGGGTTADLLERLGAPGGITVKSTR